jgi:2OG-Fe(II) oxygenase superfamily
MNQNVDPREHLLDDKVIINGRTLCFDDIINSDFLLPKTIKKLAASFRSNKPFPHLVSDGLFSPTLLELVYDDFSHVDRKGWARYYSRYHFKEGSLPNTRFARATQLYFDTVYSGPFLDFISRVTSIGGLITDPALWGGGLHEIPKGGQFALHIDFNKHPVTLLDNRLVLITYLNKEWNSSYGGALELWDQGRKRCVVKVEPVFGRSILFYQSALSLHGHPDPVDTPDCRTRRSIAAYYYTNGRPDSETQQLHGTIYPMQVDPERLMKLRANVRSFIPPVLYDLIAGTKR